VDLVLCGKLQTYVEAYNNRPRFALTQSGVGWTPFHVESCKLIWNKIYVELYNRDLLLYEHISNFPRETKSTLHLWLWVSAKSIIVRFHISLQLSTWSEVHPTPPLSQCEARSIIVRFYIGLQLSTQNEILNHNRYICKGQRNWDILQYVYSFITFNTKGLLLYMVSKNSVNFIKLLLFITF